MSAGEKKLTPLTVFEQLDIAWCALEGARQVLYGMDASATDNDELLKIRDAIDAFKRHAKVRP